MGRHCDRSSERQLWVCAVTGGVFQRVKAPPGDRSSRKHPEQAWGASDNRTYLRIYSDANGETHMQNIDITLLPQEVFKNNPPLRPSETLAASGCSFCRVPSGMRQVSWHTSRRKLVIWLTGEVEFETSDGDIRRGGAGSIVLAEDTTGKGHVSRHPPEGQLLVFV